MTGRLVHTRAELATWRAARVGRVAVVMTMGALHAGHVDLLRAARAAADTVIATIFVNPLQFGPGEDLARYPRTLEADVELCRAEGVDLVFAPSGAEIYPDDESGVRISPGPFGSILEGVHRPGHFDGVLTVVLKLLNLTRADLTFFGEKDYQQLVLVRAMIRDLNVPADIIGVRTARSPDGLALSSRNRFLAASDREAALALSRALRIGVEVAESGQGPEATLMAARGHLATVAEVKVDYLELTDPMLRAAPAVGAARLLVAARVGGTRLIDNVAVNLAPARP